MVSTTEGYSNEWSEVEDVETCKGLVRSKTRVQSCVSTLYIKNIGNKRRWVRDVPTEEESVEEVTVKDRVMWQKRKSPEWWFNKPNKTLIKLISRKETKDGQRRYFYFRRTPVSDTEKVVK